MVSRIASSKGIKMSDYNYVHFKISEIRLENTDTDPRRAAFQTLLGLVAEAMMSIEKVDECDYSPGDDHKDIDAVFAFLGNDPKMVKKAAAYDALQEQLETFFKGRK